MSGFKPGLEGLIQDKALDDGAFSLLIDRDYGNILKVKSSLN